MSRSLRAVLNESNQSLLAMAEQGLPLGDAIALLPRTVRSNALVSNAIVLPTLAKARAILKCFVRAGGVTGYFVPDSTEAVPASGHVTVNQVGDILFLGADAVTDAEVTYEPIEGDIVTETIPVVAATGIGTLNGGKNALVLISAVAVGGAPGAKIVDVRAASAPAAGHAKLNLLGQATFAVADAVTSAVVTYVVTPGIGQADPSVGAQLDSQVQY